jgi:hypothetical protein
MTLWIIDGACCGVSADFILVLWLSLRHFFDVKWKTNHWNHPFLHSFSCNSQKVSVKLRLFVLEKHNKSTMTIIKLHSWIVVKQTWNLHFSTIENICLTTIFNEFSSKETAMSKLTLPASTFCKRNESWNTHGNVTLLEFYIFLRREKACRSKVLFQYRNKTIDRVSLKPLQGFLFRNFGFMSNFHFFFLFRHCCAINTMETKRKIRSKRK